MDLAILYAARATFFGDLVVVLILDCIQQQTRRRKSEIDVFKNYSELFYRADQEPSRAILMNFMLLKKEKMLIES